MTLRRRRGIDNPDNEVRCHPNASPSVEPNDGSYSHYRHDSRINQVAYNAAMAERVTCDVCGRVVPQHAHYVVRIDVFADPEMPHTTSEELAEMDFDAVFAQL